MFFYRVRMESGSGKHLNGNARPIPMKKFILILAALTTTLVNAATERTSKSKIEKVTVYLTGAQVYRSTTTTLSTGNTVIILDDLEQGIEPHSIQASGIGNFTILDVKHRVKYPEQNPTSKIYSKNSKEIKLLEDSLMNVDYELEEVANKQEVLNTERHLLLNHKLIKGESRSDTLPVLRDALIFLREKLNNINAELLKLKKENQKLSVKRSRIELNLNELRNFEYTAASAKKANASYQLLVTVASESVGQATISVSYLLPNAGWTPSYDLRTGSTNANMQLSYKANVYQSTGVDWNDVKLTLSTNNPRQGNIKPVLSTYFLNYYNTYAYKKKQRTAQITESKAEKVLHDVPGMAVTGMAQDESKTVADFTIMEETMLNYEYNIKLPYTIPSDGQTHIVAVQNKDVPASFEHFAIPKSDNNAFLLARLSGWDDLNLIPGTANVFFDGSYVGQTYVDPQNTNDTLELSMGRDKSIVMKRVKLKDKTKVKILVDEKVQTVSFEITIRNTKSVPVILTLEDQIPVSQLKEIKVELKESSGGKLDETNGKLTWNLNIKPKDTKKIVITYEVKYPKDKVLSGL